MDNEKLFKPTENLLMVLIILSGCALRLIGLGSSSLTLNEAENALAALRLFGGGDQGRLLYTLPTALLFKMFGDQDFIARLFPAFAGIILVLLPLTLRKRFGTGKMLLLAFLFAVDPVLLFWSKRADAVIPAITLAAAAVTFMLNSRPVGAWTCFLLALSGGERSLPMLTIVIICGTLYCFILKADPRHILSRFSGKRDLAAAVIIFLLFITAFSLFPAGISAFGTGIADSFKPAADWAHPGIAAVVIAVLVYCGIPLLLFLRHCISSRQPAVCALVSAGAILLILWQGIMALPWITLSLWIGSLDMIRKLIKDMKGDKGFPFWLTAGAVAGSFSFFYFRLVEVFNQQNGNDLVQINWNGTVQVLPLTRVGAASLLTAASLLIILLIIKILLGFFDSDVVRRGIIWGLMVICSWGLLTNIWNVGGFDRIGDHPTAYHTENSRILLNGNYTSLTQSPLFEFLSEIAVKHGDLSKDPFGLNLITDDPLLDWELRKFNGLEKAANVHADLTDIELILSDPFNSFESGGFAGTMLTYRSKTDWTDYNIQDWGKWLLFGDGKNSAETSLIIWAKGEMIYSAE